VGKLHGPEAINGAKIMPDEPVKSRRAADQRVSTSRWYVKFLPALITGLVIGFAVAIFARH
jgi:hypothetical protein